MNQKPALTLDDARRMAAAAEAEAVQHQWAVAIAMLEGGVPSLVDGHCVGAVGVSGVKSTEDAQIARAGIAVLSQG